MPTSLHTHVDRCAKVLERHGVRLKRSAVDRIVAITFGYDTSNHAHAVAEAGDLDPPEAALAPGDAGTGLVLVMDPVADLPFAMHASALAPGRNTRYRDHVVTPYGNLVSVARIRSLLAGDADREPPMPGPDAIDARATVAVTDRRLAELLAATGDIALGGRDATGYNGRVDVKMAFKIFDALHNIAHVDRALRTGNVHDLEDTCVSLHHCFGTLPVGTVGRDRMLRALAAFQTPSWSSTLAIAT